MIKYVLPFLLISTSLFAQGVDTTLRNKRMVVVESVPDFPGGPEKLNKFLNRNLKYPKEARRGGVEGVVVVKFVIEQDGKVSNPEIVTGEPALIDEALRVVRKMPKWLPGKQQGKPVKCDYTLPIIFKLEKEK